MIKARADERKSDVVKSEGSHSPGTNTGKAQPKGTKAATGQGCLRWNSSQKRLQVDLVV